MTKELIERLRRIAVLEAESAGFSKEDAAEWEAADAIESLQAANDVTVLHRDSLNETCCKLTAERDALAAKLVPLEDYDAKHLLSLVPHYFGDTGDMYGMRVLRFIEAAHGIDAAKGGQHEDA